MNWNDLFHYNPETGALTWKPRTVDLSKGRGCNSWNQRYAGTVAGMLHHTGYVSVKVNHRKFPAHRIVWEMHNGPVPKGMELDHKDRQKANNVLGNLRLATRSQNNMNKVVPNKYGFMGVSTARKRFTARITVNGRIKRLGTHDTPELAHEAYKRAAVILHGDFAQY